MPITPDRFKTNYKYAWDMSDLSSQNVTPVGKTKLEIKVDENNIKYIPNNDVTNI